MKIYFLGILCLFSVCIFGQKPVTQSNVELDPMSVQVVKTNHSIQIGGRTVNYTATAGYLFMKADTGKVLTKIFFTYYQKEGEDSSKRPLTFTFNGGPGSASLWLHMGVLVLNVLF